MVKMSTENLINVLPTNIAASTELTNAQKMVLGQMIVYSGLNEAKENDGWFFRSNEDLCNDIEVSKPTLIEALRKLQAEDLIDRRVGSRAVGASEYRVKWVNLDTYPSKGKMGKVENFTNNDDVSIMILNELIKLNEAIGKIGKVLESLDLTQMDAIDAILSMGKMGKVDKPTPDTDTDKTTISTTYETYSTYCKGGDGETEPNSSDSNEVCSDDADTTPDNRKFSEQYDRIQRAIWEVKTNNTPDHIKTMQRVMDDAVEKARMYATEKQHNLIDRRIDDFQKEAYGSACTPDWIDDIPDYLDTYSADVAMICFFQRVDNDLKHIPEQDKRSRYMEICLQKAVQTYSRPYAELRGYDVQKAARIVTGNFERFIA